MAEDKVSKAEAVRRIIAEEPDLSPTDAVALIKSKFGVEMTTQHFSTTKSQELKRKQTAPASAPAPARAKTRVESQVAQPAAAPVVGANPLDAARAVKELVDLYGAETVIGLAKLFGGEGK